MINFSSFTDILQYYIDCHMQIYHSLDTGYYIADKAKTKNRLQLLTIMAKIRYLQDSRFNASRLALLYYHAEVKVLFNNIHQGLDYCLYKVVTHYVCSQLASINKKYRYYKLSVKLVKFIVSQFKDSSLDKHQITTVQGTL